MENILVVATIKTILFLRNKISEPSCSFCFQSKLITICFKNILHVGVHVGE